MDDHGIRCLASTSGMLAGTISTNAMQPHTHLQTIRQLTLATQQLKTLHFAHIHAHCGHPWNELADA